MLEGSLSRECRMRIRRRRFHSCWRRRKRVLNSPRHSSGLSVYNCNRISPIIGEISQIQHAISAQLVHPRNIFDPSLPTLESSRTQPLNLVHNDTLPNFPFITEVARRRRPRPLLRPLPCLPLHNRSGRTKMACEITRTKPPFRINIDLTAKI